MLSGVPLSNAGGEVCGGTLAQAFAVSCNSVFAPLGAKLGADAPRADRRALRLQPPAAFPSVAESTIPPADAIGDDLAVGSSAIGQGRVQATAVQMAEAAGVDRQRRPAPPADARPRRRRARREAPAPASA